MRFLLFLFAVALAENLEENQKPVEEQLNEVDQNRGLNGGLGIQLGPVGAGFGGGFGLSGLQFNGGAGLGNYGQYSSYNPYLAQPVYYSTYPASYPASRALGLGGGLQLGPVGFGVGGGLTPTGIKFGAGGGLGSYGNYDNYYQPSKYASYYPWNYFSAPTVYQENIASRNLGGGLGFNFGPVGLGLAAGLGNNGIKLDAGIGLNDQYQYYGTPSYYSSLYQNK